VKNKKIIIAIDGYSSCGKSTLAKDLARELSYVYVDTGAMYRAITLFCIQNNLIDNGIINEQELKKQIKDIEVTFRFDPKRGGNVTVLNGNDVEDEIRNMEVSNLVSPVSALKFVRDELVKLQRKMGTERGIVMDGRDIGTVVFPDAELKLFVVASAEIRAQRRFDELKAKGVEVSMDEILKNVTQRDNIDSNRKESPLRRADDAILLDNTFINQEQQLAKVLNLVEKII
jgi:CMP/dCMP kinase